jgi:hypothetical protein
MTESAHYLVLDGPDVLADEANVDVVGVLGGAPRLPAGELVPDCSLCGSPETFFFLVRFPSWHSWSGWSLAAFSCTNCADEERLIPEMLSGALNGAHITVEFLTRYQINFRFLVFPSTDEMSVDHRRDRVAPASLRLITAAVRPPHAVGSLGGEPVWLLADETPGTIAGVPAQFMLQLFEGLEFPTVVGAPPQVELKLDGKPGPSPPGAYKLFIANELYLFGGSPVAGLVYALTQTD